MICHKHGMTMLTYCEECRIEELEHRWELMRTDRDKWRARADFHATEADQLQAKLDAVINAVYDGCDCDCRGNVNKALQEKEE